MLLLALNCENPDILRVIYFIKLLLDLVFIVIPIGLIVLLLVDFGKMVIANDTEAMKKLQKLAIKRVIMAIAVFFIPAVVNLVVGLVNDTSGYMSCWTNATKENIDKFQSIKDSADKTNKTQQAQANKTASEAAIKAAIAELDRKREEARQLRAVAIQNGTKEMEGATTNDNYQSGEGKTSSSEPDPLRALTWWYQKNPSTYAAYNPANFSVMSDKDNGYSLGAWPKNANVNNLSKITKRYQNGLLIFPVDGDGSQSYDHNGIDILTEIGTPVYAPCDGTLRYSEWGHTVNRAATETAYSASITMSKPFSYTGKWASGISESGSQRTDTVKVIYLTHMIGLKRRVPSGGNTISVKQGDLIGFTGIANSVSHLHITFYDERNARGLFTPEIQKIYGISGSKKAGS